MRRRTDIKDSPLPEENGKGQDDERKDKHSERGAENVPFGGLKRSTTGGPLSAGPSSPWSANPQGGGFSTMGAFGGFSLSGTPQSATEKRPGLGSMRGESRFTRLMNKDSSDNVSTPVKEKSSTGSLGKTNETEPERQDSSWMEARTSRPMSNDTDPFPDDQLPSGSAALRGGTDSSPPRQSGYSAFNTPNRQGSQDPSGFSAFGMTSDLAGHGLRDLLSGRSNYAADTPQGKFGDFSHDPTSPTDTNPYQSPDQDRVGSEEMGANESEMQRLPGLGGFTDHGGFSGFSASGGLNRNSSNAFDVGDRSQTSSTGPSRGLPGLGSLGGLPGLGGPSTWSTSQPLGTPSRNAPGGPLAESGFGSIGELQSPSLSGLGAGGFFGTGSVGRGSRMGSLFPTAMQEQMRDMRGLEGRPTQHDDGLGEDRQPSSIGSNARNAFGASSAQSIPRPGRGLFDDLEGSGLRSSDSPFSALESGNGSSFPQQSSLPQQTSTPSVSAQNAPGSQRTLPQNIQSQQQSMTSPSLNQAPPAQQRTMVMPDRMRWIYRDPQGTTQGPWSGLEMHDWYKAGFFTPELLVKKEEDPDYEPLAHLIRRIGNSREPFLVPQIGIPHGPPATQGVNAWANQSAMGPTTGAQPPFASSFPSFGTTLTAEQQNALERRKQEEQYLMARQKEHLAQQQVLAKQMQIQGGILPNQLHHHGSAHSLHSQPSFGSITSPAGYQPSPTQGPVPSSGGVPGLFDSSFRQPAAPGTVAPIGADALSKIKEEDISSYMDRLQLGRLSQPFGQQQMQFGQTQDPNLHAQQVATMLNDRARLQREQEQFDQRVDPNDLQAARAAEERFQQFQDLREQADLNEMAAPQEGMIGAPSSVGEHMQDDEYEDEPQHPDTVSPAEEEPLVQSVEPLSLTEQVKAASAKQTPAPQSPWGKVDTSMPQPFPPPQVPSPMPAPVAQRKQNVADNLHAESRSQSQTPSVETPSASIAPWAKEPAEAPRGPSLKEIQEAEAKKAAQQEAIEAAARKAALERERQAAAAMAATAPAPGLPSSSTWGSGASPVTPTSSTTSVWAQPLAGKIAVQGGAAAAAKKSLSQIQKEEEARKQRAAAAAVVNAPSPNPQAGAKRYAELASKVGSTPSPNAAGGAWTTVGASGKPRNAPTTAVPTGPAAAAAVRAVSGSAQPLTGTPAAKKPGTPARSTTMSGMVQGVNAQDEFRKWAIGELRVDLKKGIAGRSFIIASCLPRFRCMPSFDCISVTRLLTILATLAEGFVTDLLNLPAETDLITEAVHSVSETLDSRHFAEEFVRRRKLADKGIVDTTHSASPANNESKSSGGWSEVAKKGPTVPKQDEGMGNFRVVGKKGKGGRK